MNARGIQKKKTTRKGFTIVEIMLVISIIGFLSALGIPSILRAYENAQNAARDRNIAEVEKAKGILTLPRHIMTGAMGLKLDDSFDEAAVSNLLAALNISDLSKLDVGNTPITIGDLTTPAYY
jgi:prepilin-type N-terminal cleavage/methylation domain-containing protein